MGVRKLELRCSPPSEGLRWWWCSREVPAAATVLAAMLLETALPSKLRVELIPAGSTTSVGVVMDAELRLDDTLRTGMALQEHTKNIVHTWHYVTIELELSSPRNLTNFCHCNCSDYGQKKVPRTG